MKHFTPNISSKDYKSFSPLSFAHKDMDTHTSMHIYIHTFINTLLQINVSASA